MPTQGETGGEAETLALPLIDGVVELEGETLGVTLGEAEALSETLDEARTLGVSEGVPLQMQTPSEGAPQERRQQSAGQGVGESEGETLGDCVGTVCVALGVMQVQTMLG